MVKIKRQQPSSQRLIICHRHWHYSISTGVTYDLDITNILVVSPQIRYIELFDITNPPFNEQIWSAAGDFVKFNMISFELLIAVYALSIFRTDILLPDPEKMNHFCNEANIVNIFCTISATPLE